MKVNVCKLRSAALLPTYATDGSGCFDLYSLGEYAVYPDTWSPTLVHTGLGFEVPEGHVMLVFSRSGHGKINVSLANSVGVVDSDYRGEVKLLIKNNGEDTFDIQRGDRVAQAMIIPIPKIEFEEVQELSQTTRGAGGFGSTGV